MLWIEQIPLSNDTMNVRCTTIVEDVQRQLIAKPVEASCFALQFNEITDIGNDAQLIVYFRIKALRKLSYIFCYAFQFGRICFDKLDEFFQNENLSWKECVAVTTDGAAVMMGKDKRADIFIKQRSQNCKIRHCVLHRGALAAKKVKANSSDEASELEKWLNDVKIVNAIRVKAKRVCCFLNSVMKCLQITRL